MCDPNVMKVVSIRVSQLNYIPSLEGGCQRPVGSPLNLMGTTLYGSLDMPVVRDVSPEPTD